MEKDQVLRSLQSLRPAIGSKADKLWKLYLMADDREEQSEIVQTVSLLSQKHLDDFNVEQVNLIPPDQQEAGGEFHVGRVLHGNREHCDFGLNKDDFIRHVGVFGSTGSGKTTACYNLLNHLLSGNIPFLVLDWKRDYRDLLKLPEFKDKLHVFTVGRDTAPFRFNPRDKPPGIEDTVWQKKLMEIISHAYLLGPGAEDVFMEGMQFRTFGEMQQHVLKQEKQKKARELLWWASAKRTLSAINFPGLAEVVNAESLDIPDLLGKPVILELDALSDSDKVFLIGSLLMWLYYYRMSQPDREVLKHVTLLEEAHHLLLRQPPTQQESYADVLMREIRVFGEGMIVADQQPSRLSQACMANLNTKLCLSLNFSDDVRMAAKSMFLEQPEHIGMLKTGQAVIKSHRITFPFLAQLPDFRISKGVVPEDEVQEMMKQYPGYSGSNSPPEKKQPGIRDFRKDETPPSPLAKILLQNIAENPFLAVSQRYKMLGLGNARGNEVQQELLDKGLVEPCTVDGKRLLELTTSGRELLKKWKIPAKQARGGIEHNYWLEKTREKFRSQGFTFLEKDDIDLVVETEESTIAVQVETGKSDIRKNIRTLEQYRADRKLMLATNKQAEVKIKPQIPAQSGISLYHAKSFVQAQPE